MKNRNLGIILSYANTGLNLVCGLVLSSYFLRVLGATEYGIYQMIGSFANYLVLLEFGTGTVITRNIVAARTKNEGAESINKNFSTIFLINIILSLIIFVASIAFYFSIGTIYKNSLTPEQIVYGQKIFVFITVYLLVSFFSQTMNGLSLAFEDYSLIPLVSIVRVISRTTLLIVILFYVKYSIVIAMVDAALGLISGIFLFVYCFKKYKVSFKFKYFSKEILKVSFPLCFAIFLQTIVNQANNNVDKFIIGIKLDPASVSIYSVALYIYSMFSSLTTIPISMYAPQIVKSVNINEDKEKLTEEMIVPSRFIVIIGGAILFGFVACGRQFVSIVYGEEYIEAWIIAILLMAPMLINMSNGILINVLDALNKRMFRSFSLFITTVLNIILTIFFIDFWGMTGAAIATAICVMIGQITVMNVYYSKNIKINVLKMYKDTFKGILIYQILGAAGGYFAGMAITNSYLSFIAGGVTFVIIAFGGYVLFGRTENEKSAMRKFIKKHDKNTK